MDVIASHVLLFSPLNWAKYQLQRTRNKQINFFKGQEVTRLSVSTLSCVTQELVLMKL